MANIIFIIIFISHIKLYNYIAVQYCLILWKKKAKTTMKISTICQEIDILPILYILPFFHLAFLTFIMEKPAWQTHGNKWFDLLKNKELPSWNILYEYLNDWVQLQIISNVPKAVNTVMPRQPPFSWSRFGLQNPALHSTSEQLKYFIYKHNINPKVSKRDYFTTQSSSSIVPSKPKSKLFDISII